MNDLLLSQILILTHLLTKGQICSVTRVIFLEHFPHRWVSALLYALRSVFLESPIYQTALSIHGVHALNQVKHESKDVPLLVLVDAMNHAHESGAAVHFKDMLYAHPNYHFIVLTNFSVGTWNIPDQFGMVVTLPAQREIINRINLDHPELTEEKQRLLNSASHSDLELCNFAEKIVPQYRLEDLVLSPSVHHQFLETLNAAKHKLQGRYQSIWRSKHSRGHGVILLFYGRSGTGKTMAAEVLAHSLGYSLYRANYSKIQSKYVGETEKNLESIFNAAKGVKGVILFDEGDSLFAKRTENISSNDRYANQEVGYLLQAIEHFEGIVIVNTNHDQELDPAFLRRFTRTVRFTVSSGIEVIERLWRSILPDGVKLEGDFDFSLLAMQPLTGGDIRNVWMNAFLAAEGRPDPAVTMIDLLWFSRVECQKKGMQFRENGLPDELLELVSSSWEQKILEAKADPLHVKHVWNSKDRIVSPEDLLIRHRRDRILSAKLFLSRQKKLAEEQTG